MQTFAYDQDARGPGWSAARRRGGVGGIRRWLLRQAPASIVGEGIALILVVVAVFGPALSPHDPIRVDMALRLTPPSHTYPFGTDELGRDVLSRVLHGGRATLGSVVLVLALVFLIGIPVGAIAGYVEGWVDEVMMRISDLILAFPPLVLAMALVVAMGPSLATAMLAVALVRWPRYARLVRAQVLALKHRPFVEAARALGAREARIAVRHVLPNALDPVLVRATVDSGYIILTTASLSFIGLGAQPPAPEWGAMVASGRTYMVNHWWVGVFPGLAIMLSVVGLTLFGDEIRDRFDPTLRRPDPR